MQDKALEYCKRFATLDENRANWKNLWQSVGDYIYPNRADMLSEKANGLPRRTLVFDDTAQQAGDICVAGLFSYLTSPHMPWFKMVFRDVDMAGTEEDALWLEDCEQRMYFMFTMSNFYKAIAIMYQDLVHINHGIMFIDEDTKRNRLIFRNLSPRDTVIVENSTGRVNTLMRKIIYSAEQAYQEFGEKLSDQCRKDASENPDRRYDFLHTIMPREKYNTWQKDSLSLPFESCYIDMQEHIILDEGGYHEFPAVVPRWSTYTGDVYGSCPSIMALNDTKTINKMMELYIKQGEKALDPPLDVSNGYKNRIRTTPGGINVRSKSGDEIRPIVTTGRVELSDKLLSDRREQIREKYFVSTFLMLSQLTQRMTTYEVSQRENEKMMMLGPAIGRIMDECLSGTIERSFNLMLRGGYFLPPPQSMGKKTVDVEYLSPLARAQKAVMAGSIDRLVAFMAPLTQLYPDIGDNIDPDKAMRFYADVFAVPKSILRGIDAVQAMRQERAKLQQEELLRQQALQATEGIKQIAQADRQATGDISLIQQLMGGPL